MFDEIEKASDALWNLLLGILDKGTLTLGDNRKVDFSRALIFMTSNLGATEMSALINPRLGFNAGECAHQSQNGTVDEKLSAKMARSGADAAQTQVHAGVHQSSRQDRHVQAARHQRIAERSWTSS